MEVFFTSLFISSPYGTYQFTSSDKHLILSKSHTTRFGGNFVFKIYGIMPLLFYFILFSGFYIPSLPL